MLKAKPWGREWVLYQLLRLGPLFYGDAKTITGWKPRTFKRALDHACRPRGSVKRTWIPDVTQGCTRNLGAWLYQAKNDEELRRLPPRKKRSAVVSVQSRMPHVRRPVPVVPAAHAAAAARKKGAAAQQPGVLDVLWARGGAAADHGHPGLEEVVAC